MEALAAVSLAGNILQFVDFTISLIARSNEIYKSASGTTLAFKGQECITNDLKDLSSRIKSSSSTSTSDSLLDRLCAQCQEVAEELHAALVKLSVKDRNTRSESVRKSLKALWGKDKLKALEARLAGFRQELTLHVTVDLNDKVDVLSCRQTQSFRNLDNATQNGIVRILEIIEKDKNLCLEAIEGQAERVEILHAQTQHHINQDIASATRNLETQTEILHNKSISEEQKTRVEILDAISIAATTNDRSLDELHQSNRDVSHSIIKENHNTQVAIVDKLDSNQEVMRHEIRGLQTGLEQLKLEIDRKTEELKVLVIKIGTTPEGPRRKSLRGQGNYLHTILMSLHELYDRLQVNDELKAIIHFQALMPGPGFAKATFTASETCVPIR
ncbi:hypothetical protein ACLMJK_008504 [Lecanora helva]